MSFSVVFKKEVPPFGTLGGDHVHLAKRYESLDKIAAKNDLPTLGPFVSADPKEMLAMAEDFGLDPEQLEGIDLPPLQWFKAADGLSAVRALVKFLEKKPKSVADGVKLLDELRDIEKELAKAASAKVQFHFELVM